MDARNLLNPERSPKIERRLQLIPHLHRQPLVSPALATRCLTREIPWEGRFACESVGRGLE